MTVKKAHQSGYLQIRISDKIKEQVQEIAASYSMSTSEYVRYLLLEDIRKHKLQPIVQQRDGTPAL